MIRVGLVSAAHVHASSYAHHLATRTDLEASGLWDDHAERGQASAKAWGMDFAGDLGRLLAESDAVIIASENLKHADLIEAAARQGKPILCEKPLAASASEAERIESVLAETGVTLMTAFPCPFSPTFQRLKQRIDAGDIGRVLAVNATNRGKCPFGWFVDKSLSGGGAMIDHVVHVADLLWRLFGEMPTQVTAQTGHNMHQADWEDTAHLTLDFPSGVFATLDSSWSRHKSYKTWGDVTLKVIGEKGVIEADLFGQGLSVTTDAFRHSGTGSDLDGLMIDEFLSAVVERRTPLVTAEDGLRASQIALKAYQQTVEV